MSLKFWHRLFDLFLKMSILHVLLIAITYTDNNIEVKIFTEKFKIEKKIHCFLSNRNLTVKESKDILLDVS